VLRHRNASSENDIKLLGRRTFALFGSRLVDFRSRVPRPVIGGGRGARVDCTDKSINPNGDGPVGRRFFSSLTGPDGEQMYAAVCCVVEGVLRGREVANKSSVQWGVWSEFQGGAGSHHLARNPKMCNLKTESPGSWARDGSGIHGTSLRLGSSFSQ
jgi:hypothetical protein